MGQLFIIFCQFYAFKLLENHFLSKLRNIAVCRGCSCLAAQCASLIVVKQRISFSRSNFRLILSPVTSQTTLSTTYYNSTPHFYYLRMYINTCTAGQRTWSPLSPTVWTETAFSRPTGRSTNSEPAIPDCVGLSFAPRLRAALQHMYTYTPALLEGR